VQLAEPPHDERRLVGVATGIGWTVVLLGDPDVGHSVEDPIQRDSALRTGERRTRAGMDAADERDLLAHVMTIGTRNVLGFSNLRSSRLHAPGRKLSDEEIFSFLREVRSGRRRTPSRHGP